MKALRFDRFDESLDALYVADLPTPIAAPGEVVVRIAASSINPSDVKNVQGKMEGTVLPRTPGRDFAGVVVSGAPELIGREVWGAGGDIGFTRDGAHAEYIVIPAAGVRPKPASLSMEEAASVGVNFLAAYEGVEAMAIASGDVVSINGSGGGVGNAVVQLVRWRGGRSIGVDRHAPGDETPAGLRPDEFVASDGDIPAAIAKLTDGRGVDAVYDAVGAPLIAQTLASLTSGGRWALIASAGSRTASLDLLDFYHKQLHLIGIDTRKLDTVASASILDRLARGFESGDLLPPRITDRFSIDRAREAYNAVASGSVGKGVFLF
jgi:NADPH:quinone reductase-like Zn-dependent oxidoreductase